MAKTVKFTISMPAAEFKEAESLRRKTGRTRSRFFRDAFAASKSGPARNLTIGESHGDYEAGALDLEAMTDQAERRRRAIAAAGKFRSGTADLSSDHDRYLGEAWTEGPPREKKR